MQIGQATAAPNPNNSGACKPWPPAAPAGQAKKLKGRDEDSAATPPSEDADAVPRQKKHGHPHRAPALATRNRLVDVGGQLIAANASIFQGLQHDGQKHAMRHTTDKRLTVRQVSGGSYLDPNVYAFLDCSNDDYDPCDWGEPRGEDVADDGDGSHGSTTDSTMAPSSTATDGTAASDTTILQSSPISTSSSAISTTSSAPATSPSSASSLATTVPVASTTIYVLSTNVVTSTTLYTSELGVFQITANVRTEVLANAIASTTAPATTPSAAVLAPRADIIVSDYNLNYYSSYTAATTVDPCSAGNFYVYGAGTPKPKTWHDYPTTVAFASTISLDDTGVKLSSFSYTNAAAPSVGDGGVLWCGASTYPCTQYVEATVIFSCNVDALAGYMTTMEIQAECPVTTTEAFREVCRSYTYLGTANHENTTFCLHYLNMAWRTLTAAGSYASGARDIAHGCNSARHCQSQCLKARPLTRQQVQQLRAQSAARLAHCADGKHISRLLANAP